MDTDTVKNLRNHNVDSQPFIDTWQTVIDEQNDEEKTKMICKIAHAQIFRKLSKFFDRLTMSTSSEQQQTLFNLMRSVIKMCSFIRDVDLCQDVANRRDFRTLLTALKKSIQAAVDSKTVRRNLASEFRKLLENVHREAIMPDDFRLINLLPTARELNQDGFNPISPVLKQGPYDNVEHYLSVQFRLLREDYVGAVRAGIYTYREALSLAETGNAVKRRHENIRVYLGVHFERCKFGDIGTIAYKVNFEPTKNITANYETSKFFMNGSLLFFSRDNFRTFFCGRVHGHDIELLNSGRLHVKMDDYVDEDFIFRDGVTFTMIEANVYWEPYSLVLEIWKCFYEMNFPMREFIVEASSEVGPPSYLYEFKEFMVFDRLTKPLDSDTWPTYKMIGHVLNESQYEALKTALTTKLCVIQGPPGTGKTRLGSKIVEILLRNMRVGYRYSISCPILVICYSNHALDQFLERILRLTDEVIRVGGQSRSEELDRYNLKEIKAMRRAERKKNLAESAGRKNNHEYIAIRDDGWISMIGRGRSECRSLLGRIDTLNENLKMLKKPEGIFSFDSLQDVMTKHVKNILKSDFSLIMWLLDEKEATYTLPSNFDFISELECDEDAALEEIFEEKTSECKENSEDGRYVERNDKRKYLKYSLSMNGLKLVMKKYKKELDSIENKNSLEYTCAMRHLTNLARRYFILSENMERACWTEKCGRRMKRLKNDPFTLSLEERWSMYFSWLENKKMAVEMKISGLKKSYTSSAIETDRYQEMEDADILKSARVVGMTTTGAARYNNVLRKMKPSVVIVEEAAEVLEAHIVANLIEHTKHLIMIGDHKQLKPSIAVHELSKDYNLDCSLFERIINNGIYCPVLKVQHRMRPEISSLVSPIYKKLQNHESVEQYESVRGVLKDVFFVDHTNFESGVEDSTTYVNVHEANFVLELCTYLVNQGYNPERITLLTTYVGQVLLIKQTQAKMRYIENVRVCVVDEYQGEENDIIILSLVRSNKGGNVGFLKTENRICVALSRAKIGLYVIGNMTILAQSCALWRKIREKFLQMKGKGIGPKLTLRCEVHGTFTDVETARDFDAVKGGGCHVKCGEVLACTHPCTHSCHIADPNHEEEFACRLMAPRDLECGHTVTLACSVQEYSCTEEVEFDSPHCKHKLTKKCSSLDTSDITCTNLCKQKLDCGHKCILSCHPAHDHTYYVCEAICGKKNENCIRDHACRKKCSEECGDCSEVENILLDCGHTMLALCGQDTSEVKCSGKCGKPCTDCSAPCQKECWEDCWPCPNEVEKVIEKCGHVVKVSCSDTPTQDICEKITTVEKRAACGHDRIYGVPCSKSNDFDPEDYVLNCEEPCGTVLSCQHSCVGSCKDCIHGRLHVGCQQICGADLNCGHKCADACDEICSPCPENSFLACIHFKAKRRCGAFYSICEEPCEWKCEHQLCTKFCGDLCDREPCDKDCTLELSECGHPCLGFCGEPCPPVCRICHKTENIPQNTKYVLLEDCGCVIESRALEDHLQSRERRIAMYSCPKCDKFLVSTMRYMNRIKIKYEQVVKLNKKIYSLDSNLINLRDSIKKKLEKFCKYNNGGFEALKNIKVQFLRIIYDKHDAVNKQCLTNIGFFLELFETLGARLDSALPGLTNEVDFKMGVALFSEVLSRVQLGSVFKNKHKMTGLRKELMRMHRILDYCVLLQEKPTEKLKANNERLSRISERIKTLCYQRKVYGLEEDREINELFDEFFSLEPKRGRYSFDDAAFNKIKYLDFLCKMSVRNWLICERDHFYYSVNEDDINCPECSYTVSSLHSVR